MTRADILYNAKQCVCGQRETDYGTPENNFRAIANLWSAYYGQRFTSLDVAMMMTLLKVARIRTGTATEDSFVDAAGYIACGGEISTGTEDDPPALYANSDQISLWDTVADIDIS